MSKGAKTALVIAAVVVGLVLVFSVVPGALGWRNYGPSGMMGWWGGWGLGFMFLMPLLGLTFIGLIVWAIVAALGGTHRTSGNSDSALEILRQRYAKGEIGKEEYEAKKKDLTAQ